MRWALLADVHANVRAFRAVLDEVRRAGAKKVILLGDVVGYGDDPAGAVALARRRCAVALMGNHDAAVAGRMFTDDFIDRANGTASSHRQALDADAVAWLRKRPYVYEGKNFACAHGDLSDPKAFNYVSEAEDAAPSFADRGEQLLFVGHTHVAMIHVLGSSGVPHRLVPQDFTLEDGKRYIVNPGSVGCPRDGSRRASWAIYDDRARTVEFGSIELRKDDPEVTELQGSSASEFQGSRTSGRPGWLVVGGGAVALAAAVAFGLRLGAGRASRAEGGAERSMAAGGGLVQTAPGVAFGEMAAAANCTISAGTRKVAYEVKLAKGSAPAWAVVSFVDANGGELGEGGAPQLVKQSRKSPRSGVRVPAGATLARLTLYAERPGAPLPAVERKIIGKCE